MELTCPRKARAGDKVAVLSPSFAAPAVAPAVHEQALQRLHDLTGLVPVESLPPASSVPLLGNVPKT
jgi:hypothetical protein